MPSYLATEILTLACRALPQGFESSLSLTIFLTIRPFCVFIKSFKWLWITYCSLVTVCASSTLFLVLFWGFFFVFSKKLWTLTWRKKKGSTFQWSNWKRMSQRKPKHHINLTQALYKHYKHQRYIKIKRMPKLQAWEIHTCN